MILIPEARLARELACQEAKQQRAADDDADPMALGRRQERLLGVALEQVVAHLDHVDQVGVTLQEERLLGLAE